MKFLVGLLVASLAVGGVLCLPAGSPSDDAEVINVPRRHSTDDSDESSAGEPDFKDFRGVIDTGVGYPFLQPHPLPFSFNLGFFDAFEDIFRRLSSQIWPSTDELGAFDTSKGNTTSTVKVVDGHKVEVNETVYGDGDNLFKVRLVNIRPLESGEDVAETPDAKAGNPVTSAPNKQDDESESNERREPLEKNSYENEIKHNIDDPEPLAQLIQDTMLPITNENNAANLNAAFVTDNSLEAAAGKGSAEQSSEEEIAEVVEIDGNIEAETNKSVNNSEIKAGMENLENTTTAVEELTTTTTTAATPTTQDAVEDEALTIENNEETAANNSPNESSNTDDDATAAEAAATEAVVVSADDDATNVEEDTAANESTTETADDLRAELDEENINETASGKTAGIDEVTELMKSADDSAEWLGEDAAVAAPSDAGIDEVDNEPNEKRYANYANNKNREDLSSSDDEAEGDEVEMNPGFDSEWGDLKADLARASSEQNDLSNDIDAYDAVPVDLSNDIAVNDIAAQNPDLAVNPDAEVFDVNALKNPGAVPMFEKLTISEPASPAK